MAAFKFMGCVEVSKERMWDTEERRAKGRVLGILADLRLVTVFF